MKRRRFIAGILVLSMLLMGTGYAYWTDKLDIKTTVSTGELKVKFLDLALYGQYDYTDDETGWSIIDGVTEVVDNPTTTNYYFGGGANQRTNHNILADPTRLAAYTELIKGYTNTTFDAILSGSPERLLTNKFNNAYEFGPETGTILADTIEIKLDNLYPGYAQVFQADIANMGTLTAKLSGINASIDGGNDSVNYETKNMIGIALHVLREYSDTQQDNRQDHVDVLADLGRDTLPADAIFTVGGVKFLRIQYLPQLYNTVTATQNLFVYPDENRMDIYFAVAMDPDAEGHFTTGKISGSGVATTRQDKTTIDAFSQNETAKITVDFLWDQFNVGVDAPLTATNRLLSTN